MEQRVDSKTVSDAIKLIGGGLIGAGIALLFAPQAGKQTRNTLVRYAKTFGGKTPEAVYDFSCSIAEFMNDLGKKANEIINSGTELSDEAKRGLLTALEKGQERLEKQKKKLVERLS